MRYGPSAPLDLPVREVADLHEHRHADLVDAEAEVLVAEVDVADTVTVGQVDRLDRLARAARCRPCGRARPARGRRHASGRPRRRCAATRPGRRRRASPPTRRGSGTSSCRARGCARAGSPPRSVDDHRLHRRAARRGRCRRPGRCSTDPTDADERQLGLQVGLRLGRLGEHHDVLDAERLQVRHADWRRRCRS